MEQSHRNEEIWRDRRTGLPMHNHGKPIKRYKPNGRFVYDFEINYQPCACGDQSKDVPLHTKKES